MEHSRNKLQELSMICIYQYLFYIKNENRPPLRHILESVLDMPLEEIDSFLKKLVKLTIENADDSVKELSKNLIDWEFERLNLVDQAILLTSYSQSKFLNQPKQVSIEVGIKLAKKYCEDDAYKYINVVLDKCLN